MSYILFYSKVDKFSQQFISLLTQTGQINNFIPISVDKDVNGKRPNVVTKYQIASVPTIIVNNQKLSGVKAFEWVEKQSLQNNRPINTKEQHINPQTIKQATNRPLTSVLSGFEEDSSFAVIGNYDDKNRPSVGFCNQAVPGVSSSMIPGTEDDSVAERRKGGFLMQDDSLCNTGIGGSGSPESTTKQQQSMEKSQQFENKFEQMQKQRQLEDDMNKRAAQPYQ